MQLIVLDLPGTHSPAINKAIGIAEYHADPDEAARRGSAAEHRNRRCRAPRKQTFAYIFTFVPATGQQTAQMRDTLEDANLTIVPGGIGDRPKEFADAIENGQTVQERNPNGKSAGEICAVWKWLKKRLGGLHGGKVD